MIYPPGSRYRYSPIAFRPLRFITTFALAGMLIILCVLSSAQAMGQEEVSSRLELLEAEWRRDPDNLKLALLLGGELRKAGADRAGRQVVEQAMDAAQQRMEAEGDSAELQYMLGMGALFLNRHYLARERFQMAIALQPEREEVHLALARSLLSLGKTDEAMATLELAITLFPDSGPVKAQMAEALERSGRYEEAVPLLEELQALYPEEASIVRRLLRAHVELGDAEKIEPQLDRLVEMGALSELERELQEFRLHMGREDLREARVALQEASRIAGDHSEVKKAFRDYYALQARQAEEAGNHRRAILFWERAQENAPEDWQVRYRLGLAHASSGDHAQALDHYLPVLKLEPGAPRFYADLSQSLIALDQLEAATRVIELGWEVAARSGEGGDLARLEEARARLIEAARSSAGSESKPE